MGVTPKQILRNKKKFRWPKGGQMLTLKYKVLQNQVMNSAISKLAQHPDFDPKIALEVAKIVEEIDKKQDEISVEWTALVKANAFLDEKGNFVEKENHDGKPIKGSYIPKDKDDWDKKREAFGEQEFTINAHKINLVHLKKVGLNPMELRNIEPILTDTKLQLTP